MDIWARRLAKPEEADGDAKSAHKSRWETFLGFEFTVVVELRLCIAVEIPEEGGPVSTRIIHERLTAMRKGREYPT